ncbi:TraU family protein (plasmid) [Vibrio scophthalmi]|uniref:TraU family protein n=1 Tax=Vibrio scophthalmi TaxID=45658 RepID=UPI003EB79AE6
MLRKWMLGCASALLFWAMSISMAAASDGKNDMAGDLCPNADILSKTIDGVCWSCLLPIRLAGIGGNPPDGAADSKFMCNCMGRDGMPEIGMPLGFFQPQRIVSFSPTPYCMPSFGVRLSDDNTRSGQARTSNTHERGETSFYHYKYWQYPLMAMIEMFMNADCTYDSAQTIDLAYFSEADPLYQDDMLAFLMAPESVIFANPVATSICTADCAALMAGGEIEENYFCAGCSGNLYPMTGRTQTNDDPIRVTSLLTTRLLAMLHRRGQALLTMGDHMIEDSCEPKYAPMLPKTQYRASMLYPKQEAASVDVPMMGDGAGGTSNGFGAQPDGCCHKLGDSVLKWGNNKLRPGQEAYIYMLYRWNDCCLR